MVKAGDLVTGAVSVTDASTPIDNVIGVLSGEDASAVEVSPGKKMRVSFVFPIRTPDYPSEAYIEVGGQPFSVDLSRGL